MSNNFRVGQKVVCMNDTFISPGWGSVPNRPVRGRVYTIRGIAPQVYANGIALAVLLEEKANYPLVWPNGIYEMPFPAKRFRPAVDKPADISIFTKMLTPTKRLVSA